MFMGVGDCLRGDKNDTALSGLIFLNNVAARKFLPLVTIFLFKQEDLLVVTAIMLGIATARTF